ncbi:MAG TPA: hypothetical protein VFQ45_10165 [Longimicrobium sp.]|nr:hypothetical protein [Longimicrobium sp.]
MPQYSLFTHGNALEIETPANLAGHVKIGWGTVVGFREPVPSMVHGLGEVYDEIGPGSWFHLPLPSTLTTFGRENPYLDGVTLLFQTIHCRIKSVHVYDGADLVHPFDGLRLKGDFLRAREPDDVDPGSPLRQSLPNTLTLPRRHRVFSAIGLSFFACAHYEDFSRAGHSHNPRFHGPFPASRLIVAAGGAQFVVPEGPFPRVRR